MFGNGVRQPLGPGNRQSKEGSFQVALVNRVWLGASCGVEGCGLPCTPAPAPTLTPVNSRHISLSFGVFWASSEKPLEVKAFVSGLVIAAPSSSPQILVTELDIACKS